MHRTHTQVLSQPHTHTNCKVLSQHLQIRLHVTFPIKGFLERLNPKRGDIPAFRAEHRLTFLCAGPLVLISRRLCHTEPRFPQDQRPSCEHSSSNGCGNQLQMWHASARTLMHTLAPCHTDATTRLSRNRFLQAEVIKVT